MIEQEEQSTTVKDRACEKLRRDLGGLIIGALSDP
ncbi:MAG: P-type conjugative transfer ATPase TrbB, partial [Bacteroidetes bacterium]|nr:P-type conjugative transfer ATPase TrbB [Bacteroidota bacterium]